MNKAILIGNIGKAPEMRFTPNGSPVTSFSLATSDKRKNTDGSFSDDTQWHNIVCWNKTAENVNQYCSIGSKVAVEGKITQESWEKDGQKHYITKIIAQRVEFLTTKQASTPEVATEDILF